MAKMKGVGTGNNPGSRKGDANLIDNAHRSKEEVRKNGSKGGRKQADNRKAKDLMREAFDHYLKDATITESAKQTIKRKGIDVKEKDVSTVCAIVLGQIASAINGDTQAAKLVMDAIGFNCEQSAAEEQQSGVIEIAPVLEKEDE